MKTFLKTFILALLVSFASSPWAFEQDFSKIQLKTTQVRDNIYMLEGVNGFAGGNIGVSTGEDGLLIIDDQLRPMTEKISAALAKLSKNQPKFILNTHWHGDHTGNNLHFGEHGTIISHTNVRKRLMSEQENFFGKSPVQPKQALPLITFDQALTVHFNGDDIQFIHYPHGHTDSDGIIYFPKSRVAHLGDHFFNGVFPFVDLDTGGNVFSFTQNVKTIIGTLPDDALIIPGHGPLSDMTGLKTFYEMLVETSNLVKDKASRGESLESIQKAGLPKKYTSWGHGFINEANWIKLIYNSISQ